MNLLNYRKMEQLSIRLKIGNREYPMTIKKEEEELIRKVGKKINEQINSYKTKMNIDDPQDLLAMVAFDSYIKLSNQNKSPVGSNQVLEKLKEMNKSVDNYL